MGMPRWFLKTVAIGMAILISNIPAIGLAEGLQASAKMIPTSVLVNEMTRTQAEAKVRGYLNRDDVKQALLKQGLSPDEVSMRVASLSDQELKQLAGQMDSARYGGDILVAILLVVLIIFLIKRI